jgi:bifunctional DNase/RNase
MKKIKLEVVGMSPNQAQVGSYVLVLGDEDGMRRLPVIIGMFEAQAIAMAVEKMMPSRPLTHDLVKNIADAYQIEVNEVLIYNLQDGVFFSKLITTNGLMNQEIDARTSDAIALAVRFGCPIYTYENILREAASSLEDKDRSVSEMEEHINSSFEEQESEEQEEAPSHTKDFSRSTVEQLNEMLHQAIDGENYELASAIRDELSKRKSA